MPKVNVYLPDELAAAVRSAQLPISTICQVALRDALSRSVTVPTSVLPDRLGVLVTTATPSLPFSPHIEAVLSLAVSAAARRGVNQVESQDILQALLDQQESLILRGLAVLGLTAEKIQRALDDSVQRHEPISEQGISFSTGAADVIAAASAEAHANSEQLIHGAHLVWALANAQTGQSAAILRSLGFFSIQTRDALRLIDIGVRHGRSWHPAVDNGYRQELSILALRLDRIEGLLKDRTLEESLS